MNIALKIQSPAAIESFSTFDVGVNYNGSQLSAWSAYIVKARPHIAFRHEGVCGEGNTLDEAIKDLHRRLYERMYVALETRASQEAVIAKLVEKYDGLTYYGGEGHAPGFGPPPAMDVTEKAVGPALFEMGWTLREVWQRGIGGPLTPNNLALWRQEVDKTGKRLA